jgi:hypothetical protein
MLEASSAKDLNSLGMASDGNYEEWFDGWDVFPDLGSLKSAAKRGRNTVFARFYGATHEETITDGATIGFGGSEDPHNPNWITHKEEVADDKSHIFEGDMVTFTIRRGAKQVKLRGKVIEKDYDGNWGWQHKNDGGHFGRPTCSLEIRLAPKAMADAIAKLEVDESESASAFGADGADTLQRIVDGDPREFDKETDRLADLIRTYAIRNRSRIPAGIDAFREYQLAILDHLHGIGPRACRHAKKLLLSWN